MWSCYSAWVYIVGIPLSAEGGGGWASNQILKKGGGAWQDLNF